MSQPFTSMALAMVFVRQRAALRHLYPDNTLYAQISNGVRECLIDAQADVIGPCDVLQDCHSPRPFILLRVLEPIT